MTRGDVAQERMLLGCGHTALILYTETSLHRNVFTENQCEADEVFKLCHGLHAAGGVKGATGMVIGIMGIKRFTAMRERQRGKDFDKSISRNPTLDSSTNIASLDQRVIPGIETARSVSTLTGNERAPWIHPSQETRRHIMRHHCLRKVWC